MQFLGCIPGWESLLLTEETLSNDGVFSAKGLVGGISCCFSVAVSSVLRSNPSSCPVKIMDSRWARENKGRKFEEKREAHLGPSRHFSIAGLNLILALHWFRKSNTYLQPVKLVHCHLTARGLQDEFKPGANLYVLGFQPGAQASFHSSNTLVFQAKWQLEIVCSYDNKFAIQTHQC